MLLSTPTMSYRKKIYREGLFDSPSLDSLQAVESALYEFESVSHKNNCAAIVTDLLSEEEQFILPLVLSNVNIDVYNPLRIYLSGLFTMVYAGTFTGSVAHQVLSKLSDFLHLAPLSFSDRDILGTFATQNQIVHAAPDVLKMISTMDKFPSASPVEEEYSEDVGRKKKSKHQKRRLTQSINVDTKSLKILGYDVPKSRPEAEKLTTQVMEQLKGILSFYLDVLRTEAIAASIKESCVFTPEVEEVKDFANETQVIGDEVALETETPSAYPKVQPIRSALHFDSVEGFGEWTIIISQGAEAELRTRHRKEKKTFDIIVKKIRELSNGHFSADNQKRLNGVSAGVAIFEAKMTGDLRLIYQVDVVASGDETEQQAIKIFGIHTHAQANNHKWEVIGNRLGRKGKEYRDRCAIRVQAKNADDQTFFPASFPPLPEIPGETALPDLLSDDTDPVYSRLLMDKYVVFSQPLLNTMLADLEATFPHVVSSQEKLIIEHPYSSYVIGRSGTGKTTTLLFKMLLVERSYQLAGSAGPKPRQIFITQSRLLAKKVEEYFATLSRSLAATSQPLDVLRSLCASQEAPASGDEDWMFSADDDVRWNTHLPDKYSELEDKHFPLFTTFDDLCKMLEADISANSPTRNPTSSILRELDSARRDNLIINYEVFFYQYWKHFSQSLTSRLDPTLVFGELVGVIKGSEETLSNGLHYLTLTEYQNLSTRKHAIFSEIRSDIYSLFNAYIAKRKKLGGRDGADRTHSILDFFKSHGIPGHKVDRLYVDEVQDNLLIDTLILRSLCHDADGLFWAGDTAQTISVGSSFRFEALRAFQWRLERKRRHGLVGSHPNAAQPKIFDLAVNYRSHAGIVNCAHSVIDLLDRFWPDTIDKLSPEKGVTDGPKPIFFDGWDEDAVGMEQFIFGTSRNRISFGAQQCILVRDKAAQQKLKKKVGNVGLVLTIYESKGLEFDDVLLYNFFGDSSSQLFQWQVILNALDDVKIHAPDFGRNKLRYASICLELKFLYVAITRARENLWIVDSTDRGTPLKMYWIKKDLVRTLAPGMDIPRLAATSTLEEWAEQGRYLFEHKQYAQAKLCFERAGLPERVAIADAYVLRENAERLSIDSQSRRNRAFHVAAEVFVKCSASASGNRRLDFLRIGANCYRKADELTLAAEKYYAALMPTESALCYCKASRFNDAVKIVKEHASIKKEVAEGIFKRARDSYSRQLQSLPRGTAERDKKLQQLRGLSFSDEDLLKYLEEMKFDVAQTALLEITGKTREAAELHKKGGRVLDAIDLFLEMKDKDSSQKATSCALKGLWQKFTFGDMPKASDKDLSRFFDLVNTNIILLEPDEQYEARMFQAISAGDQEELHELSKYFYSSNKWIPTLLCLDHYFTNPPRLDGLTVFELAEELELFIWYTEHLLKVSSDPSPSDSEEISRLFGFQKRSENQVLLPQMTYLHRTHRTHGGPGTAKQDTTLDKLNFHTFLCDAVKDRLARRTLKENENCQACPAFTPCLVFALYGECTRPRCSEMHVLASSMNTLFYNTRVRVHLLQMLILETHHTMHRVPFAEVASQQRLWLQRLYNALHPVNYRMGTSACLNLEVIPEADEARQVVRDWVQAFLKTEAPGPDYSPLFLSNLLRITTLAQVLDKNYASNYLHQGRYAVAKLPPHFKRPEDENILDDLVRSLEGFTSKCIVNAILSIGHVVEQHIHIDIGVLCDLLDRLCKNIILANCAQRDVIPHNVTVPCSWVMDSAIVLHEQRNKEVSMLDCLVHAVSKLLEQVHTGGKSADFLLYGQDRNLSMKIPPKIRSLFIGRICRALCLLGYNIQDDGLRKGIHLAVTSLRSAGNRFSSMYKGYVCAESWPELAMAVRRSTRGSSMDEIVQLLHKSQRPPRPTSYIRQVIYDNLPDIPNLLKEILCSAQSHRPVTTDPANTRTLDQPIAQSSEQSAPFEDNLNLGTMEADEVEDIAEQKILNVVTGSLNIGYRTAEPMEKEQEAARKIQVEYKRYRSDSRIEGPKSQLADLRQILFLACQRESQQIGSSYYRKVMLGPLPHVLASLELLFMRIMGMKDETKKLLRLQPKPEEIRPLHEKWTKFNLMVNKIKDFQMKLGPRSTLHLEQSQDVLEKLVEDLGEFIRSDSLLIGISADSEARAEFDIGYKGIVKIAPTLCKQELNVEDT